MLLHTVCLLFSFLLPVTLPYSGPDDKAARILRESESRLESIEDFRTTFSYSLDNPNIRQKPPVRTGTLLYKRGMYSILLEDQEIYCDLSRQWYYDIEGAEVSVTPYEPEEGITLEGIFEVYKNSARAQYLKEEIVEGNNCHKILVNIQNPDYDYVKAYVWINIDTLMLAKVALIDSRQTVSTYVFKDLNINVGLSTKDFIFDAEAHPGVRVIDED